MYGAAVTFCLITPVIDVAISNSQTKQFNCCSYDDIKTLLFRGRVGVIIVGHLRFMQDNFPALSSPNKYFQVDKRVITSLLVFGRYG